MIRLLIADDEKLEREALAELVQRRFEREVVLEVAEKLCNKIAIIKDGRLIACGETASVKGSQSLEDVFLELTDDE